MVNSPAYASYVNDLPAAVPLGSRPEAAVAGLSLLGAAGLVPVSTRPARVVQSTVYTN
mgnify:CR=1 FL=1